MFKTALIAMLIAVAYPASSALSTDARIVFYGTTHTIKKTGETEIIKKYAVVIGEPQFSVSPEKIALAELTDVYSANGVLWIRHEDGWLRKVYRSPVTDADWQRLREQGTEGLATIEIKLGEDLPIEIRSLKNSEKALIWGFFEFPENVYRIYVVDDEKEAALKIKSALEKAPRS